MSLSSSRICSIIEDISKVRKKILKLIRDHWSYNKWAIFKFTQHDNNSFRLLWAIIFRPIVAIFCLWILLFKLYLFILFKFHHVFNWNHNFFLNLFQILLICQLLVNVMHRIHNSSLMISHSRSEPKTSFGYYINKRTL